MRVVTAMLVALGCFGQGVENRPTRSTRDESNPIWVSPAATFAKPPSSPSAGAVYVFSDALSQGNCAGGGVAMATCQWNGSAWRPVARIGVPANVSNTVVLFGASITGQNTPNWWSNSTVFGLNADGYWNWANAMMGQPFTVVNNGGHSGMGTTGLLGFAVTDVLAFSPGWVVMGDAPINDLKSTTPVFSAATIIANLTSLYNTFNAAGIRTIMLTIPPFAGMGNDPRYFEINHWIKTWGATHPNFCVVDSAAIEIDPVNGGPLPNMTMDGVHLFTLGAFSIGKAIANTLTAMALVPPPAYTIIYNNDPTSLVTNGMQTGMGGTVGRSASGLIASSWTLTGYAGATCVGSKKPRADGMGEIQSVTMTGTSAASYCELKQTISGWSGTDTLQMQAEIMPGSTLGKMITGNLVFHAGSDRVFTTLWQDNPSPVLSVTTPYLLLQTAQQAVWNGTTATDVSVWMYGTSGTIDIGRVEVHKL
uniref:SGNH hydrolase-type esterase domain-containing protein n=1 Tax=Solibacter usitatus (strain Ellin6076) TaxID=234267 RepID=Q01TP3_SOLUE